MNEKEEKEAKKTNWAGIAALIAASATIPGVLANTYFDFKERNISQLAQKSSHDSVSDYIEDIGVDVDECHGRVDNLEKEIAELRGFMKGSHATAKTDGGRRAIALKPEPSPPPEESSVEAITDNKKQKKRRRPAAFDTIIQHVQSTGEVYQMQDQDQFQDER